MITELTQKKHSEINPEIQEIMLQYEEFQEVIRKPLGKILRENNPEPDLFLELTPLNELEKQLVRHVEITKEYFLRDVRELKEFPAEYVEPFAGHCRWDCEYEHNEGCNELDCLKFWAEYSPDDFLEAVDYV